MNNYYQIKIERGRKQPIKKHIMKKCYNKKDEKEKELCNQFIYIVDMNDIFVRLLIAYLSLVLLLLLFSFDITNFFP